MKLAYLEVNEKPELTISHTDFEYRLTGFTTRNDNIAEGKLIELSRLGQAPVCVKYEGKYYIYIKIRDDGEVNGGNGAVQQSLQVPENTVPESGIGGDTETSISDN
jgi:hypothetical protein